MSKVKFCITIRGKGNYGGRKNSLYLLKVNCFYGGRNNLKYVNWVRGRFSIRECSSYLIFLEISIYNLINNVTLIIISTMNNKFLVHSRRMLV